jgi:SAM-dependent methyltransferase
VTPAHLVKRLIHGGPSWLAGALRDRIRPARPSFSASAHRALLGGSALEIGGPSRLFRPRGGLPAYDWLEHIDNVNFAGGTAWENGLRDGGEFRFNPAKPAGRQLIREAVSLSGIADDAYDAVLSCHCLEHVANPLAALHEWRRVTRPGGALVLVLPDPARTFDRRRAVTAHSHLISDYQLHTGEDDLTHLEEALTLHDLSLDPAAGDREEFTARSRANARHRCLHHHVFDLGLIRTALAEAGWRPLNVEKLAPIHLVAWAVNPARS